MKGGDNVGVTRIKFDPVDYEYVQRTLANRAKVGQELFRNIPGIGMCCNHTEGQTTVDYNKSAIGCLNNFKHWDIAHT